jgi:hypothetical protein
LLIVDTAQRPAECVINILDAVVQLEVHPGRQRRQLPFLEYQIPRVEVMQPDLILADVHRRGVLDIIGQGSQPEPIHAIPQFESSE